MHLLGVGWGWWWGVVSCWSPRCCRAGRVTECLTKPCRDDSTLKDSLENIWGDCKSGEAVEVRMCSDLICTCSDYVTVKRYCIVPPKGASNRTSSTVVVVWHRLAAPMGLFGGRLAPLGSSRGLFVIAALCRALYSLFHQSHSNRFGHKLPSLRMAILGMRQGGSCPDRRAVGH